MATLYEIRRSIHEAGQTLKNADDEAECMALILRGRLRKVPSWVVQELKKELTQFNSKTREWKN